MIFRVDNKSGRGRRGSKQQDFILIRKLHDASPRIRTKRKTSSRHRRRVQIYNAKNKSILKSPYLHHSTAVPSLPLAEKSSSPSPTSRHWAADSNSLAHQRLFASFETRTERREALNLNLDCIDAPSCSLLHRDAQNCAALTCH